MPRITPLSWQKLVCVFEQIGYCQAGQKGSHIKLERPGSPRPIIIPRYEEIGPDIILNLIRTANISRDEFFSLLKNC
jgi:predicted RNA binding protein YcfA (HicA-like mRNA interferase family)